MVLRCSGRSLIGYYLVLSSCCLSPLVGCLVPVLARLSLRRTRSILLGVGFRLTVDCFVLAGTGVRLAGTDISRSYSTLGSFFD